MFDKKNCGCPCGTQCNCGDKCGKGKQCCDQTENAKNPMASDTFKKQGDALNQDKKACDKGTCDKTGKAECDKAKTCDKSSADKAHAATDKAHASTDKAHAAANPMIGANQASNLHHNSAATGAAGSAAAKKESHNIGQQPTKQQQSSSSSSSGSSPDKNHAMNKEQVRCCKGSEKCCPANKVGCCPKNSSCEEGKCKNSECCPNVKDMKQDRNMAGDKNKHPAATNETQKQQHHDPMKPSSVGKDAKKTF